MLAAYDRTHNSGWSWCFHNKHNLFIVGAKSMGMKIGEGCRNACTLFDLITQTGQYRRASRMFMLLEMVRASIRKEMAPVFGGSITLLVNRHRFPLYAISLEIVTPYLRSFIFISARPIFSRSTRNTLKTHFS